MDSVRALSIDQYISLDRPHFNWLVPGMIPNPSTILLLGSPKAGKSFLAFDIALRIAKGQPIFHRQTYQSKVLFLQFDTSEMAWRDRLNKIKQSGVSVDTDKFVFPHPDDQPRPFNIMNPKHYTWMKDLVTHLNPSLVVIDVFRDIHLCDENDSTQMKIVGDAVEKMFHGRSLLLVHHAKKIPDDVYDPHPINYSRGSTYITGKVDAIWLLYRNYLKIDGRFDERRTYKLDRHSNGLWDLEQFKAHHDDDSPQ